MSYNVYIIKLKKEVIKSKKFRDQNLNMNPKLTCYYVGQTSLDPKSRFDQHKAGYKSNNFVKKYGTKLAWRLFKKYNPIDTREKAEYFEKILTEKLRSKGHGIWSH
jgi:predicted GIY-YIG superfamily endonuclease